MSRVARRMRQTDRNHPWLLDSAVALGVVLMFCVPDLVHGGRPPDAAVDVPRPPVAEVLALQAALVLPLLWRRRSPSATFTLVTAVFLFQWSLGVWLRADVALMVALYSLALHGRLRHLPWACAVMAGAMALVAVRLAAAVPVGDAMFVLFSATTAALALGLVVRIRRAQLAGLRDHAARLEIERDQRSKLAAAAERTRVAREMHDIVGHNLSVIITLADGGAYAAKVTPQRGAQALELIGDTGRQALGELRRMLGVLREQADAPQLSPQPGIADIDALCRRIRAAGPDVVYRTTGEVDALDPGVQLTVYRIAQEALTNALKHAGAGTRIELAVALRGSRLRIQVLDTGPPPGILPPARGDGEGHGLAGMRERAALYSGSVTAGPRPGGGWTARAVLDLTPLPETPLPETPLPETRLPETPVAAVPLPATPVGTASLPDTPEGVS
ncbi:histidine kinase [Streptomyces sp. NPDC051322]|uniref:sensor histidine kinase n=1 Tax=Streptomyces sp. NPDC051322 TaxID=3154645 RepID=UPI0034502E01